MPRFLTRLKISTALFMLILGLGIPIPTMGCPQDMVRQPDPELINLYYAELGRSHCDHLTVAVLQGSKEGVVVSLFPPGNDGTRKNNDPIPGIDIIVERDTEEDPGLSDASSIISEITSKADVKQCEDCGATCTEPCRCNPTGIELIFGKNDDQAGMMQASADFTYLTFQTSDGMRSVTLISMGPDSKLTLVIAKGWGRTSGDCDDSRNNINPGKIVNSEGNESLDPNPLAAVGTMHNEALDYLTPDLNLNLFQLPKSDDKVIRKKPGIARQGEDLYVRKRPGRKTYANISLEPAPSLDTKSLLQHTSLFFMQVYDLAPTKALASEELASEVCLCAQDGYGYFENFQKQLSTKGPIKAAFEKLEETVMLSPDLKSFNRSIDQQVLEITKSQAFATEETILILGSLSLAKGTVAYWNAQNDIFEGDVIERIRGKFWADLGGFIIGAGAELLSDDENYGDAILTGLEAGAAASAAYEEF